MPLDLSEVEGLAEDPVRGLLLAATRALAEAPPAAGLLVHLVPPSLKDLAAAAVGLRTQYPRLPLIVAAPRRLLAQFSRRYPALWDHELPLEDCSDPLEAAQRAVAR